MKHTLISLSLLCTIACCNPQGSQVAKQLYKQETLLARVQDMTLSLKETGIMYYDSNAERQLFYGIANNGGGKIKLIGVYDNSLKQDVRTFSIPAIDTEQTDGVSNIYLRTRMMATNKKKLAAFTAQIEQELTRYIKESCKPPSCQFTDLQNSFTLVKQTLAAYDSTYRKVVLVSSDMRSDPQWHRHAPLQPVEIPNVEIVFIRPSLSEEELKALFPRSAVHICTSPIDAVTIITNK